MKRRKRRERRDTIAKSSLDCSLRPRTGSRMRRAGKKIKKPGKPRRAKAQRQVRY